MGSRTLRMGSTGDDVRGLQQNLANLGLLDPKGIDGKYGPDTTRAVLAYQKQESLAQDGVVGPSTWSALVRGAVLSIHRDDALAGATPTSSGGPPFLFFDLYPYDLDDPRTPQIEDPPFDRAFAASAHLAGGILKASDGVVYGDAFVAWFQRNYARLKDACGARYGVDRFRGSYHYLQFLADGTAQADRYCSIVEAAGGWDDGVIMPVVDIEFGGERAANRRATNQQIVECAGAFAERAKARTGRRCMLYGRGAMRDRSIASKMGCDRAWNPSYTTHMEPNGLLAVDGRPGPWKPEEVALWQYGGDGAGEASQHHLPLELVGFGKVDMSVHVCGAAPPTIDTLRAAII